MKRIISLVLILIFIFSSLSVDALQEKDCRAWWKMECSNSAPKDSDNIDVKIYLKTNYISNVFGAVVTYDKTYYEPAKSTESDNFEIAPSIVFLGNKSVVISEKKSAEIAGKMYDETYDSNMRKNYALAWFSFTFLSSKFSDPANSKIPSFNEFTHVATLKLRVKKGVKSGIIGKIMIDEAYVQKDAGNAGRKYTFVAHANNEIIGKCTSSVRYGQTIDVSNACLFEAIKLQDIKIRFKSSQNLPVNVNVIGNYKLYYESSNPSVVSVNSDGKLVALKNGTAQLSVTLQDQNMKKVTEKCNVEVVYEWWQWIIIIALFGWIWYK